MFKKSVMFEMELCVPSISLCLSVPVCQNSSLLVPPPWLDHIVTPWSLPFITHSQSLSLQLGGTGVCVYV